MPLRGGVLGLTHVLKPGEIRALHTICVHASFDEHEPSARPSNTGVLGQAPELIATTTMLAVALGT